MNIKRRRNRQSSSPEVVVAVRMDWRRKATLLVIFGALAILMLGGAYRLGRSAANLAVSTQNGGSGSSADRESLANRLAIAESQLSIERAAEKQLVAQVKDRERETAKLKEDLLFFESLIPATGANAGISIRQIRAEMASPTQVKYGLLVMQGGRGEAEFSGTLQFTVTALDHGKSVTYVFPDPKSPGNTASALLFKHYQRVEGVLSIPEGVQVKTVQAKVMERGLVRAQQSANL